MGTSAQLKPRSTCTILLKSANTDRPATTTRPSIRPSTIFPRRFPSVLKLVLPLHKGVLIPQLPVYQTGGRSASFPLESEKGQEHKPAWGKRGAGAAVPKK